MIMAGKDKWHQQTMNGNKERSTLKDFKIYCRAILSQREKMERDITCKCRFMLYANVQMLVVSTGVLEFESDPLLLLWSIILSNSYLKFLIFVISALLLEFQVSSRVVDD